MVDFLLLECLLNLNFPSVCPGGSAVKNPAANAEDVGSIPGLGRSHVAWSNEARVLQLLSRCSRARELQLLHPCAAATEAREPGARVLQQEKHHSEKSPQLERSPWPLQLERAPRSNEDAAEPKNNNK